MREAKEGGNGRAGGGQGGGEERGLWLPGAHSCVSAFVINT